MKKRLFLLIPISLFAFGLVTLALAAAGAASVDKPTGVEFFTPVTNSAHPIPINHSVPGFSPPASAMVTDDQRSGTEIVVHGMSPVDQMRQEAMNASHSPDELDRVEFWLNQSSISGMWGHADPGTTLTITTPREQFNAYADPGSGDWGADAHELYPGDQITVEASTGDSVTITIPDPIEAHADSSLSEVWGEIGGWYNQDVEVHRYWAGDPLVVQTDGSGAFVATDETMPRGARGYIRFVDQVDTTQVIYHRPYYDIVPTMRVNYAHEWVESDYEPGYTVWLTLTNSTGEIKDTASGETGLIPWWGGSTGFATGYNLPWSSGQNPDIQAGDWVYVSFENGYTNQVQIGTIEGVLDFDEDTVSGNIYAPWFTQTLWAGCGVWVENGPGMDFEVDPNGGSYFCDFGDLGWDLLPGQDVAVYYKEPDNDVVYNVFQAPWMRVNYAHDWVGGNYPPDHTFWITVTDSLGEVKATTQIDSHPGAGWSGDGFETQGDQWLPQQPDIEPGDWVYYHSDDGYDHTIQVGDIQGNLDVDNDSVSGPIYAEWFIEELNVECHPWGGPPNTPGKNSSAAPDGSEPYSCQWDPVTEWDIQPGQDVAVMYIEPEDFDRVINVFRDPAPDMHIEKWTEGGGQVMPGGPVVFNLYYSNDGDADAPGFTITDTLPANTTYLTDTSGVTAQFGPGWVSWDFGSAQPGIQGRFQVVLLNSAEPGDTLTNTAEIFTPYDSNEGNDHSQAQVSVVDENPDLYVNKNSVPGDPAPGQTFLYEISYGNNGPVASGAVALTDTLPADTSIVSWYSENGYNLWNDVSISDDQLLLTAPTIPGYWGSRIIFRLQVDPEVAVGTQLTNTVEITTANDTNPEDNWFMNDWTWVGEPRWDAGIAKWNNWGTLVPGGQIEYGFWLRNNGNMPAQTWVTDTLPEGTSFLQAQYWDGQNSVPFPPDYVDEDIVAWNMGEMQPGEWFDFAMLLNIDPALPPDTELTNCATIGIDGDDGYLSDNTACVVDAVREPGPNLRVQKYFWWEGYDRLNYELLIQNIGTQRLDNVWFTDTYPLSTTFNGDWWVNYGPYLEMTHDELNHQLIFWIESLDRGWNADISFRVDLDQDVIGVQGLAFTNTLDAPIPEDVFPDDNYKEVVAYTGPDVYVNKWLSGGMPRPGEIVTFTVEVGNQNIWPWDGDPEYGSHITDTLPEGMTFITATAPWNPEEYWPPESIDGNEIAWGFWTMWSNSAWYFDIVAQVNDDLVGGELLTNHIEAYGDSPNDIEPNWENNVYELVLMVEAAPQAYFTTNSPVRFGEAMIFTNASIPGYPSPEYSWDFGDGSTSSDENPTHLYAAAGTYTVTLTVTNEIGSSTFSQEVEVEQPLIHLPLIFKNN